MVRSSLPKKLSTCFVLLLPAFLFGSDAAMVTTAGHALLNGNETPGSSALFTGDVVATPPGSAATIDAHGSMVLVQPNSSVQFKGNYLDMANGDVVVTTSKGMAVKVGKFTVSPAAAQSSKFEVSHSGSMIQIAARQGSLNISDGVNTQTLQEGQQTTRSDLEPPENVKTEAPASGSGGVHMSHAAWYAIGGAAAAGATAGIVLATHNSSHHPVSPATP
jgi:hypothetical protein